MSINKVLLLFLNHLVEWHVNTVDVTDELVDKGVKTTRVGEIEHVFKFLIFIKLGRVEIWRTDALVEQVAFLESTKEMPYGAAVR